MRFEEREPEITLEWHDPETDAVGWVVINSLRGGAAGGGTRMRKGLDRHEVISLAKTMEVKFTVSGPPIGGAKSGINFDPADPRKNEVLQRWFKAVMPLLKHYYGTGGDLNIDEMHDVIPITESYGLQHPQEGVAVGHFGHDEAGIARIIAQLRTGVSKPVEDPALTPAPGKYAVADLITGWGVAQSVIAHYALAGSTVQGKRMAVQGWGNVASAAGYYLAQAGALISGILDRDGGLLSEAGLDADAVKRLYLEKQGNTLHAPDLLPFGEANAAFWDGEHDVFLPCAASRLVTQEQVERLIAAGVETIACGANVPFADSEIFYGPIARYADERIAVLPDFICNSGMARVFAYCMTDGSNLSDQAIFNDVHQMIGSALEAVAAKHTGKTHITSTALGIALAQLDR